MDIYNTLRCLGIDSQTIARASEFERFAMWCAHLDLLEGNEDAERFATLISQKCGRTLSAFDAAKMPPKFLWCLMHGFECAENICDEKYNQQAWRCSPLLCDEKYCDLAQAVDMDDYVKNKLAQGETDIANSFVKAENNCFFTSFENEVFVRPSLYAAAVEYERAKNGEKYNLNLLKSQLILEWIYQNRCRKIQLYVDARECFEYVRELVRYMSMRKLTARIYLICDEKTPAERVCRLCTESAPCLLTPVTTKQNKKALARAYPQGLIREIE